MDVKSPGYAPEYRPTPLQSLRQRQSKRCRAGPGIVVRKKGLAIIAKQARLRRESLYRSPSGEFSPAFRTVMKVLTVLELELVVRPCAPPKAKKRLPK